MKTPEEMAEEYCGTTDWLEDDYVWRETKAGFLAGYKAAMQSYATKLEEANATIDGLADECEGLKSILDDHDETNLPTPAKWISVKDRLPSCEVLCAWISSTTQSCIQRIEVDDMDPWYEGFDYWCELPEPPKEKA